MVAILAVVVLVMRFYTFSSEQKRPITEEKPQSASTPTSQDASQPYANTSPPPKKLIGDSILEGYGNPKQRLFDDLAQVSHLVTNLTTIAKHLDNRHLATNADLSELLRGKKAIYPVVSVSEKNAIFNDQFELVDRWGTPLLVHPEKHRVIAIRSAGEDQIWNTADDLTYQGYNQVHQGVGLPSEPEANPSF